MQPTSRMQTVIEYKEIPKLSNENSLLDEPPVTEAEYKIPLAIAIQESTIHSKKISKYPDDFQIEKINNLFEIKKWWLFNEWDPSCQFSKYIQAKIPDQSILFSETQKTDKKLIEETFDYVRGKYSIWGSLREKGKWKKISTEKLQLRWVQENIEILYPSEKQFPVKELKGIVLWKDPKKTKYQLLEGNHRVSAWLLSSQPKSLPAIIYIGKSSI